MGPLDRDARATRAHAPQSRPPHGAGRARCARADEIVLENAGLLPRKDNDPPSAFRETPKLTPSRGIIGTLSLGSPYPRRRPPVPAVPRCTSRPSAPSAHAQPSCGLDRQSRDLLSGRSPRTRPLDRRDDHPRQSPLLHRRCPERGPSQLRGRAWERAQNQDNTPPAGDQRKLTSPALPLFDGAARARAGVASLSCCNFAAAQVPGGGQSMRRSPPWGSSLGCPRIASV